MRIDQERDRCQHKYSNGMQCTLQKDHEEEHSFIIDLEKVWIWEGEFDENTKGHYDKEPRKIQVIINSCYGGLRFSQEVFEKLIAKGWKITKFNTKGNYVDPTAKILQHNKKDWSLLGRYEFVENDDIRTNEEVIKIVKRLGSKRSGTDVSKPRVISVPADVEWEIDEYDGNEWVAECHRTWR